MHGHRCGSVLVYACKWLWVTDALSMLSLMSHDWDKYFTEPLSKLNNPATVKNKKLKDPNKESYNRVSRLADVLDYDALQRG